MNLFKLFKRKPKAVIKTIPVFFRQPMVEIRLADWRKDVALVGEARGMLNDPRFQKMLECLMNESPANYSLGMVDFATRAHWQSRIEGYNLALANLRSMAEFNREEIEPEETWEKAVTGNNDQVTNG